MPLRKVITTRFFRSQPFSLPPPSVRWYYQYLKFVRAACMCVFYTYKLSTGPPRYRYLTLRYVRYRLDTGTRQFGKVRFGLDTGTRYFGKSVRPLKHTPGASMPLTKIQGVPVFLRYGLHQYPTEHSGMAPYELTNGTRYFGKLGTTSIPVPDTSVGSVRPQHGYPTLRQDRHEFDTGTPSTGKWYTLDHNTGGTVLCSVRPQYPTEHPGMVRYELITANRTSVRSLRPQYQYPTLS